MAGDNWLAAVVLFLLEIMHNLGLQAVVFVFCFNGHMNIAKQSSKVVLGMQYMVYKYFAVKTTCWHIQLTDTITILNISFRLGVKYFQKHLNANTFIFFKFKYFYFLQM